MPNTLYCKTSSPSGDLISFLAGLRQIWRDTGRKSVIYQRLNMIGGSYYGAEQPYEDENKNPVCFNQYTFDMMRPLLLTQEYIEDFIVFNGQEFEIDFDKIRQEGFTNQPKGALNRWFNYLFPIMASDLSQVWVDVPAQISDKIIINFTERKRNHLIHYYFLTLHQDKIIFSGLKKERDLFCKQWDLDIPLLEVKDFYELAKIMKGSKFFMGNESFCMQLAESLKIPRILELFPMMPTTIPIGENAFDFYHQGAVEYYFNKLLKLF